MCDRSLPGPNVAVGVHSGNWMNRFQITLVRPLEFEHTEAFREIAESLPFGLRSIGHGRPNRKAATAGSPGGQEPR